ncbi:MAG TPA: prepilin-type N-terminal cleavage/methylation domain-containing protein [Planctomycetota bacterium]|nr:prepilin-type N-terminal cleavage/methylation domain-containing protein [Planctomycetota bacterium]
MRRGTTLIEIIIAMSIFTVLITAVLQCLTGVRGFVDRESVQNDLVLEGRRLIDVMVQDLSGSAWYIAPVAMGGPDQVTTGGIYATQTELQIPARDRKIKYYPYIMTQEWAGRGDAFQAFWRTPAEILDPSTLPSALPPSHRWASQEIIFVKIATAPPAATPRDIQPPDPIEFQQTDPQQTSSGLTWTQWTEPRRILPAYELRNSGDASNKTTWSLGIIADASGAVVDLPVRWESDTLAPTAAQLREYSYVVVPNPVSGRGQLERRYRNASDLSGAPAAALDAVLSTNVDRLVANTYRTDATLGVDQIRITLYLSRTLDDGTLVTDVVEATAAMRSIFNALDPVGVQLRLGEAGTFTDPVVTP